MNDQLWLANIQVHLKPLDTLYAGMGDEAFQGVGQMDQHIEVFSGDLQVDRLAGGGAHHILFYRHTYSRHMVDEGIADLGHDL